MIKGSYRHLNEHDRIRIEEFLNEGESQYEIAGLLKVNKSTISREINKRGGIIRGYSASFAQENYERGKEKGGVRLKMESSTIFDCVINNLKKGWSPETIAGRLKKEIKD